MDLDYKQIGQRIARCRKKAGLTQAALSEMVDISPTYMSSIERAVSIPSTEVIMRLAIALDTTPDEFLVGTARHVPPGGVLVAERLRPLTPGQLRLAEQFLQWVAQPEL